MRDEGFRLFVCKLDHRRQPDRRWHDDIGYPEDRDEGQRRLQGEVHPDLAAENVAGGD